MVCLPYSLTVQRAADLLQLERDIRTLLRCQTEQCAFLLSAEYAAFRHAVRRALRTGTGVPLSVRTAGLVLAFSGDLEGDGSARLTIRNDHTIVAPAEDEPPPSKRLKSSPPASCP